MSNRPPDDDTTRLHSAEPLTSPKLVSDRALIELVADMLGVALAGFFRHLQFGDAAATEKPAPSLLTDREREIALLIANGLNNDQIAAKLQMSVHTVRSHRKHIYSKLDVHNIAQLRDRRLEFAGDAGEGQATTKLPHTRD